MGDAGESQKGIRIAIDVLVPISYTDRGMLTQLSREEVPSPTVSATLVRVVWKTI